MRIKVLSFCVCPTAFIMHHVAAAYILQAYYAVYISISYHDFDVLLVVVKVDLVTLNTKLLRHQ